MNRKSTSGMVTIWLVLSSQQWGRADYDQVEDARGTDEE